MSRQVPDAVDDAVLASLVGYVRSLIGLRLDGPRRRHVLATLREAINRSGAETADRYLSLLHDDPDERDGLVDRLTIGETHFFRHPRQLEVLSRDVIPELGHHRNTDRPLVVWSAGCASGEEPYTLAMMLEDAGRSDAQILGTDVSSAALRIAATATYRPWSLRGADASKHRLVKVGDLWRVPDRLIDRVQLRLLNLLHDEYPVAVDLILCRNVLLYLADEQVQEVAANLAAALAPGGWLVTAPTDPNLDFAGGLEPIMTPGGVFYRCPDPFALTAMAEDDVVDSPQQPLERRRTPAGRPVHRRTQGPSKRRPAEAAEAPSSPDAAATLAALDSGDYAAAVAGAQAVIAAGQDSPHMRAVWARALGNAGRTAEAEQVVAAATKMFPLEAELRYLHAELLIEAGSPEGAASAAAAAIYLNPELAVAHLLLGRAEMARGRAEAARRAFATAATLLDAVSVAPATMSAAGEASHELGRYATTYGYLSGKGGGRT